MNHDRKCMIPRGVLLTKTCRWRASYKPSSQRSVDGRLSRLSIAHGERCFRKVPAGRHQRLPAINGAVFTEPNQLQYSRKRRKQARSSRSLVGHFSRRIPGRPCAANSAGEGELGKRRLARAICLVYGSNLAVPLAWPGQNQASRINSQNASMDPALDRIRARRNEARIP
jgi:hypothetical protein